MMVSEISGDHRVSSIEEFESILMRRCGAQRVNEFWICPAGERHPALAIMVRGDLACAHYFPRYREAGFLSQGRVGGLSRSGMTWFQTRGESTRVPNHAVVRFVDALQAAKEFWYSKDLPKSIEWLEL